MNYFDLHIGDFDKATAHLTACEDGMYGRLLRRYYDTEAPLPADVKAVQRLVRARTKEEREAVETVLNEFFSPTDDGWRHRRCDDEIARYNEKRAKAKRSAEARWQESERNADAMRTHSEGNALQSPDPSIPTDSFSVGTRAERAASAAGRSFERHHSPTAAAPNPTAALATTLIRAGFRCTATNPDLIAYREEGGTPEHLADIAAHADCAGKPAVYVIRFARRELTAKAKPINGAKHATHCNHARLSLADQVLMPDDHEKCPDAIAGTAIIVAHH